MCDSNQQLNFETSEQLHEKHQNLHNITKERLRNILAQTPALRDITCDVTHDEIVNEIAIVNGESIKIYVTREPYQQLKVIVSKNCKIIELKAAIKRNFNALQRRQQQNQTCGNDKLTYSEQRRRYKNAEPKANISWKYIWHTYYLRYNGIALTENEKCLSDYDIRNKAVLEFVKKIKVDRKMRNKKQSKR